MKIQVIIKAWKVDKANDTYLLLLFLDVLLVLLKSHAEFACNNFAIIGFVEVDIFSLSLPVINLCFAQLRLQNESLFAMTV